MARFHGTTILSVRKGGRVALGGDGQVSIGDTVIKASATKVRSLKAGKVLAGFGRPESQSAFQRFVFAQLPGRTTPGRSTACPNCRMSTYFSSTGRPNCCSTVLP